MLPKVVMILIIALVAVLTLITIVLVAWPFIAYLAAP